jgi:predicted metal-dependent HD superfamily phosphohydrolase
MDLDESRWGNLTAMLGLPRAQSEFVKLAERYGERHRKYHNGRHINDCLAQLDSSSHEGADEPIVEYALWFHDAIYNTFSSQNELRSADWAATVIRQSGGSVARADLAHSLIMATRHGEAPTEPLHQLIVDIDLSILGAARQRFDEFERQIRSEYWWIPRPIYRRQRAAILRSFLERPTIYSTREFAERFEAQARENIESTLEALHR